ncbi:hypothetical protein SCALM49S_06889 [Streptomyces californicus]
MGLEQAAAFAEAWAATGGGPFPAPDDGEPGAEAVERAGLDPALGWWTLRAWESAAVALLNDRAVRAGADDRSGLLRLLTAVTETSGQEFTSLAYGFRVLDDEPLVALHRTSRTGYVLRLSGIGDNFQLTPCSPTRSSAAAMWRAARRRRRRQPSAGRPRGR